MGQQILYTGSRAWQRPCEKSLCYRARRRKHLVSSAKRIQRKVLTVGGHPQHVAIRAAVDPESASQCRLAGADIQSLPLTPSHAAALPSQTNPRYKFFEW